MHDGPDIYSCEECGYRWKVDDGYTIAEDID